MVSNRLALGLLLLLQLLMALIAIATPEFAEKCGNLSIPYPFGINHGRSPFGLDLTCNDTYSPPKAFIPGTKIQVTDISLTPPYVRGLYKDAGFDCYNETSETVFSSMDINISSTPAFLFSNEYNMFIAIGCETSAFIWGQNDRHNYASSCASLCDSPDRITNGSCSGIGCCQTPIPEALDYFEVLVDSNISDVLNYTPCSYAMLVEKDWYNFNTLDLPRKDFLNNKIKKGYPIVLDWAIRNLSCAEAIGRPDYPCRSKNSDCQDSTSGQGYTCSCASGYSGNPYHVDGCQDINECELKGENQICFGQCINQVGNFTCTCNKGTKGDAKVRDGCRADDKMSFIKPIIGTGIGVFFLMVICLVAYLGFEKKKLIRTKRKYFEQNGGLLLQQEINSQKCTTFKIYTKEELNKATNNFDKSSIIGCGGHGIVYRGVLECKRSVAIKKSRIMDENQLKEYTKETFILSQINHKNVVKLLGCCLEVKVPILVYEFVSNSTLFHHLHDMNVRWPIPLDTRLKIAIELAEALAYLHSWASPPIIHGDVKSLNILLDDQLTAKVSDFGASKLAPMDETQLATLVQGTCGYLDPEYMQTCQLTDKSDVYSFAVVLLELITRKRALCFEGSEEERSLISCFNSAMREDRFLEILDNQIKHEAGEELFQEIAELISWCLSFKGVERPTMKEVVQVLERLRRFQQSSVMQHNSEDTECLHGEPARDTLLARLKHQPWVQKTHEETEILDGEMSTGATESDTTTCTTVDSNIFV